MWQNLENFSGFHKPKMSLFISDNEHVSYFISFGSPTRFKEIYNDTFTLF